jgi:hypothetical protein
MKFKATFTNRDGQEDSRKVRVHVSDQDPIIDGVDAAIEAIVNDLGYYPDDLEVTHE